jgi:hypothetical protein
MRLWCTSPAVLITLAAGTVANPVVANPTVGAWPAPREFEPADGLYTAARLADGSFNITYLGPSAQRDTVPRDSRGGFHARRSNLTDPSSSVLLKPDAPDANYAGVGCDQIGLVPGDAQASNRQLLNYCGGGGTTITIWFKSGDVVSYFCSMRNNPQCDRDAYQHALDMVYDECGMYHAGSYWSGSHEWNSDYRYGVTNWRQHEWCAIPPGTSG